jgi:hypothetical protein
MRSVGFGTCSDALQRVDEAQVPLHPVAARMCSRARSADAWSIATDAIGWKN